MTIEAQPGIGFGKISKPALPGNQRGGKLMWGILLSCTGHGPRLASGHVRRASGRCARRTDDTPVGESARRPVVRTAEAGIVAAAADDSVMIVSRSSIAIPLLIALAGCEAATPASRVTRSDSAGVEIVVNEDIADPAARWATLVSPAGLELGSEEEGPELFGRIGTVLLHPDGRLWLSDLLAQEVRVFDVATGEHLFTLGGPGDGPEEFRAVRPLGNDEAGDSYVFDEEHRRLTIYSPVCGWPTAMCSRTRFASGSSIRTDRRHGSWPKRRAVPSTTTRSARSSCRSRRAGGWPSAMTARS
jgi:hypothetical protein